MVDHVVGVDFGTLSGRAVVVRAHDGEELGTAETPYPHAVMSESLDATGGPLAPNWALQDADDYLEVLRGAVPAAVEAAGIDPASVVGIATDFTACTMVPVLSDGTPLSRVEAWRSHPHAWVKLWRHHAAQPQADRINELAAARGEPWLPRYGGRISSEWEFAKALQLLEEDPELYGAMDRFVEAADWIVWQLCGVELRNACTAGYKGILQDGHYPTEEYLAALNPAFARFAQDKLSPSLAPLGARAGSLTAQAAGWTGLREGIAVAVGNVDAHVTAPAAGVVEPGRMVAIMGTSTCHVMIGSQLAEVPGMCGVVDGGIVPGAWGYEAGQSGVGDILAWFVENAVPEPYHARARELGVSLHEHLAELGAALDVGAHGLVALDWESGNRSVLVDHELSGVLVGMTLATRAHEMYWALVEATAFGTRKIIDTFAAAGVPVREFVAAGGLLRNERLMRCYADVIGMPISVIGSDQGPALGSAMHAAVAAGVHSDIYEAAAAMGRCERDVYLPDATRARAYDELYALYGRLHDHFGVRERDLMRELQAMRERGRAMSAVAETRELVARLHGELVRSGLAVWTMGNLSARVPGEELFVIKPSGVVYGELTAEAMVLVDLDGEIVEAALAPSSDTATHAYVYRALERVGGIVHTHSSYATAWAAHGLAIPCALTGQADEFGGDIPVGPFARIGGEEIGVGIVETLRDHRSRAVLMRSHGVFTIGADAREALKAAVMCEDAARTALLARTLGELPRLPQEDIDALYDRYQNIYGQR